MVAIYFICLSVCLSVSALSVYICLCLPSAGVTGMCHHRQVVYNEVVFVAKLLPWASWLESKRKNKKQKTKSKTKQNKNKKINLNNLPDRYKWVQNSNPDQAGFIDLFITVLMLTLPVCLSLIY